MPTVLEGEIEEIIPALPATPDNIQSMRRGMGFRGGIELVSVNGYGGWYFSPPDPDESSRGEGVKKRVRTST